MSETKEDIPWFSPSDMNGAESDDHSETTTIFEAPDYTTLVKRTRTQSAKDYERKVQSLIKLGVQTSLTSHNEADAATLLMHGPRFAESLGDLTDISDFARKSIDILTAPDSPVFLFAAASMAMFGQLARNHEKQIQAVNVTRKQLRQNRKEAKARGEIPETPKKHVEIKLPFGRKIGLNVRLKLPVVSQIFAVMRMQTREPDEIVERVFSDPALQRELKKMGYRVK